MGRKRKDELEGPLLFRDLTPPKQVFRDIRNYLAGQFVGATRDDVLLGEVLKCLFCKLYLEMAGDGNLQGADAVDLAQFYRVTFSRVALTSQKSTNQQRRFYSIPPAFKR